MVALDVDRREAPSGIPELLTARGASIRLATLRAGDYALGRRVGIERKRDDDFARSIVDGRLFEQAGALRRFYARPILTLEGLRVRHSALNVRWPQLRGALVSLSAAFGLPVLPSSGPTETAEIILAVMRQEGRSFTFGYVKPGYRPGGWRKRSLFILQGLPAVGPSRAAALLDAFGSVQGVVTADEPALRNVPGLGGRIARRIRQAVMKPSTVPVSPSTTST